MSLIRRLNQFERQNFMLRMTLRELFLILNNLARALSKGDLNKVQATCVVIADQADRIEKILGNEPPMI